MRLIQPEDDRPGIDQPGVDQPVSALEFARFMQEFEPFEAGPTLAVAVSGGRDSMALALLAQDWARERRGTVHALIVDHVLRIR